MQTGGKNKSKPTKPFGPIGRERGGGSESSLFISPGSLVLPPHSNEGTAATCCLGDGAADGGGGVGGAPMLRRQGSNKRTDKVLFARC